MAHVQIKQIDHGRLQVVVDGVDLTDHIFREGFELVQVGDGEFAEWGVKMILAAYPLDIDLPQAVLDVLVKTASGVEA